MRVLIVEDEPKVAFFLEKGLRDLGFEVDLTYDGASGKKRAMDEIYDCIILDLILPICSGLEICRAIRKVNQHVSIIFLSAMDSPEDKVLGLDAGGDDYLTKPFRLNELVARINALSRRKTAALKVPAQLQLSDLLLNTNTKTASRNGITITLTAREYFLLEYFMKNKERVLSRVEIATNVWDAAFDSGTNIVDVYVNYLRNKIDKGHTTKLIHTVVGLGYILKTE